MKHLLKKSLVAATILASANAVADTGTYTFSFTTVPALTVAEEQAIDFGQALGLANGLTCTMQASALQTVDPAEDKANGDAQVGQAGSFQASTCASSVAGEVGQYGRYVITGVLGTDIDIEVTGDAATPTDAIEFDAQGYAVEYNTTINREDITDGVGNGTTVQLAGGADSTFTTPGTTYLILGGTITNQRALTLGETVSAGFTIDVTYN